MCDFLNLINARCKLGIVHMPSLIPTLGTQRQAHLCVLKARVVYAVSSKAVRNE